MSSTLSLITLADIGSNVSKPTYRRTDLSPGILHVGVGNFHRAHQALYLHKLFEMGEDHDWAIVGAGVNSPDELMRRRLEPQDWLSTVVESNAADYSATVTGAMIDFLPVNSQAVIDAMSAPNIRIVSMTVTEGGYYIDAQTGGFNDSHPEIKADIQNPASPKTLFGIIVAALLTRREAGIPPFTVMTCDNFWKNGRIARQAVLGVVRGRSDDAHDWISDNVAFPNSLVDCITPGTGDSERNLIIDKFGFEDAAPVICEPFHQWVLEDNFPSGRPALEKVGVQFVDNIESFELMKLRILNGGHASIAYPAALMDFHFVHDAISNGLIASFLDKLAQDEIIPTVPKIPLISCQAYYKKTVERFSNPAIGDTIPRLCFDGSARQSAFIVPIIKARLCSGLPINGLALVSALWCRYCYGTTESGKDISLSDTNWARLTAKARLAKDNPHVWLDMTDTFGLLSTNKVFRDAFANALTLIWRDGTSATLTVYIKNQLGRQSDSCNQ